VITYREATSVDLQAICVLGQEINALHHAAWPDVFAPSGDPQRDEGLWREMIGMPDATTFVAETAEGVIAFVNVAFIAKDKSPLLQPISYARVGSVGVAERHRGKGIGTELMHRAEAWAAVKGAKHLSLNVWAFNEGAVRLYEELGYEVRSHTMGKRLVARGF
jgi:ribosomal protein S18 acetylase RimI-like enzyme